MRPNTAPPSLATGTVTFGSFNNPAKLSDETLDAWATLLGRVPQARLLLKGRPFADAATRAVLARLDERGVAARAGELVAWLPKHSGASGTLRSGGHCARSVSLQRHYHHLRGAVDGRSGSDPAGRSPSGRVGASLLTQIG